jgi:membrane protease subunit HflC
MLGIVLAIVAVVVARWSFYTVDAAEYAYVTVLGRPVATWDGADPDQAGLHFGWPWPLQTVQRLDRRVQLFDLPATELLTHDPEGKTIDKTLSVEAYVLWQIADGAAVGKFVTTMGSAEAARSMMSARIRSELGAVIGQKRMDDLISVDPGKAAGKTHVDETLEQLTTLLIDKLRRQVRDEYGIELVDIRLRRFSHPSEVRSSIFARIRSERNKKVTEYREEGERQARNLESEADAKVVEMMAKAKFEETTLKGRAESEGLRIRNKAQSEDPEFYAFLKQMEKLSSILAENKSVLLLSTHRSIFDLLFQPPRPEAKDSGKDTAGKEKK